MEPNDQVPPTEDPFLAPAVERIVPIYIGFDLETTGVDSFSDVPVSYGFVERIASGDKVITRTKSGYVNPGVAIPEESTAIHGITNDMVADAPELAVATEKIAALLAEIWQRGCVIVGMNVSYDLTMIESLCTRLGLTPLSQRGGIGPVMDILVLDRRFNKYRKGGRKLGILCSHYGVVLDDAHAAAADADASLCILEAIRASKPEIDQIPLGSINETLRGWHQGQMRDLSAYFVKQGNPPISKGQFSWPINTAE
jgi:DNA polymerase-3 subunit epsilon